MNAAQRRRMLRRRPAAGQCVKWSRKSWLQGESAMQHGIVSECDRWNTLFTVRVDYTDEHGNECWDRVPIADITVIQEPAP